MGGWIQAEGQHGVVSIIIPTYNRRDMLLEALKSVVGQTYRPIQCLVVDDGSSDDTNAAMLQWQTDNEVSDIEFKFLRQKNLGAPAARNLGTRESTGEYIQYLDSDDLLYPQKIAAQIELLEEEPSLGGIFGDWEMGQPENAELVEAYQEDDLITQFLGSRCIALFAFLMRRSVVSRIGPWDETLRKNQEIDFHLRGVMSGGRFAYSKNTTGLWRMHDAERINARPGTGNVFSFYQKWIKVLRDSSELTSSRKSVISDALFHSATSPYADDESCLLSMLSLSRSLKPGRAEFETPRMRALMTLFGESVALRAWLWRVKRGRKRQHCGG